MKHEVLSVKNKLVTYGIYVRKSEEAEDRQILSIPAQLDELQKLAGEKRLDLEGCPRTEAQSAKAPGRPIFGKIMQDVQDGRIQGLICWKLDRLARNPVDGGALIWALDQGKLKEIVTPSRTFTNTGDDKFWLQLEFGMAKKYVDDLSVSVKRGMRRKLEEGGLPTRAPIGYLNDRLTKKVVKDSERFPIIRHMWDLLLTGRYSVMRIYDKATNEWSLRTPVRTKTGGRPLALSRTYDLFRNPFYYGFIRCMGELHRGTHESMITADEFMRAQTILGRSKAHKPRIHNFPFTGLIRCGECGGTVTADTHTKRSGKVFTYYHCTKKRKNCSQPYVRAEALEQQIVLFIERIDSAKKYCEWLEEQLRRSKARQNEFKAERTVQLKKQLQSIRRRLQVLAELRVSEQIQAEDYKNKYNMLIADLVRIEDNLRSVRNTDDEALEPVTTLFSVVKLAQICFLDGSSDEKHAIAQLLGSNFQLKDKKLLISVKKPFQLLLERSQFPIWSAKRKDIRTFWNKLACSLEGINFGPIEKIFANNGQCRGTA